MCVYIYIYIFLHTYLGQNYIWNYVATSWLYESVLVFLSPQRCKHLKIQQSWWHYTVEVGVWLLQLYLQGVSREGHTEFMFFFFLLLSTLVEKRCCRIQAMLLQNKKRCQSKSCHKMYFGSVWVRVSPVK